MGIIEDRGNGNFSLFPGFDYSFFGDAETALPEIHVCLLFLSNSGRPKWIKLNRAKICIANMLVWRNQGEIERARARGL